MEPAIHYLHSLRTIGCGSGFEVKVDVPKRSLIVDFDRSQQELIESIFRGLYSKIESPMCVGRQYSHIWGHHRAYTFYDGNTDASENARRIRLSPESTKELDRRIGHQALAGLTSSSSVCSVSAEAGRSIDDLVSEAITCALSALESTDTPEVSQVREILGELLKDLRNRTTGEHTAERQATLAYVSKDPETLAPTVPQMVAALLTTHLERYPSIQCVVKFCDNMPEYNKDYSARMKWHEGSLHDSILAKQVVFTAFSIVNTEFSSTDRHQQCFNHVARKFTLLNSGDTKEVEIFDDKETAQRFLVLMRDRFDSMAKLYVRSRSREREAAEKIIAAVRSTFDPNATLALTESEPDMYYTVSFNRGVDPITRFAQGLDQGAEMAHRASCNGYGL